MTSSLTVCVVMVFVVTEVIHPSFGRSYGMSEDNSRITLTEKIVKRDDSIQIVDEIRYKRMKRKGLDTNTSTTSAIMNKLITKKNTTGRQLKGYDTKINMRSLLFLASGLVQREPAQGKRVFTAASRAVRSYGDQILRNASVINTFSVKDSKNSSSTQMNFDVVQNLNDNKSITTTRFESTKRHIQHIQEQSLQGSGLTLYRSFGRNGMNPCVKKIKKTYYSVLKETLTDLVCRRASFYCSPRLGGWGRCMSVKRYYPSIEKILTTECRCK